MEYKEALDELYACLEKIQRESKRLTRTRMITSNNSISVLGKFNQASRQKGYHLSVITLHNIAKRIDFLNRKDGMPTNYAQELESIINKFIKRYILVEQRYQLVKKYNLTWGSLQRMNEFNIRKTSIGLEKILQYSDAVQLNRPLPLGGTYIDTKKSKGR
ncbi:hypothetical protein LDL00_11555 [Staphylococcus epidermidis]|uniref:hypothetical protein n=1 Tax=Staphylococcus epidermidis TaxID=1282 RepID=UPI001E430EAB|nr:hypothetical protein [Staphylococcus epidermidis]MCD9074460.1 hypothetical protein [Staphylococcus epidermidis]